MSSPGSADGNLTKELPKTLWVGDIDQYMDENYLASIFRHIDELTSVKLIRDKQTGLPAGYGFVEFATYDTAKNVLESHNGQPIVGTGRYYRLNWASFGYNNARKAQEQVNQEHSIYVGDLGPEVNDALLLNTFSKYLSVKSAKIVVDPTNWASKGYGFVRFGDYNEATKALTEMQGVPCGSRQMKISIATAKKPTPSSNTATAHQPQPSPELNHELDITNTTIYVGNLDPTLTPEALYLAFSAFGEIITVKQFTGKAYAFVQFNTHEEAMAASEGMNGKVIGNQPVRISWGRFSTRNKAYNIAPMPFIAPMYGDLNYMQNYYPNNYYTKPYFMYPMGGMEYPQGYYYTYDQMLAAGYTMPEMITGAAEEEANNGTYNTATPTYQAEAPRFGRPMSQM